MGASQGCICIKKALGGVRDSAVGARGAEGGEGGTGDRPQGPF